MAGHASVCRNLIKRLFCLLAVLQLDEFYRERVNDGLYGGPFEGVHLSLSWVSYLWYAGPCALTTAIRSRAGRRCLVNPRHG